MRSIITFFLICSLYSYSWADDITVINVNIHPQQISLGQQLYIQADQVYSGNQPVANLPDIHLGFYLSTDCKFDAADVFLGSVTSSIGSNNTLETEMDTITPISGLISSGKYYILLYADQQNAIVETDETNNTTCLEIYLCNDQGIQLNTGWNLISSYVNPDTPNITNIFSGISSDIILVKNYLGQAFVPSLSVNNIGNWQVLQGYKVKAYRATALFMECGNLTPASTPIALSAGWNLTSYLVTYPLDIANALNSISNDLILVKNQAGSSYIPSLGINGIGNMNPGQGYKIKMSNNTVLTYPSN